MSEWYWFFVTCVAAFFGFGWLFIQCSFTNMESGIDNWFENVINKISRGNDKIAVLLICFSISTYFLGGILILFILVVHIPQLSM